jgi:hypothetical protein
MNTGVRLQTFVFYFIYYFCEDRAYLSHTFFSEKIPLCASVIFFLIFTAFTAYQTVFIIFFVFMTTVRPCRSLFY